MIIIFVGKYLFYYVLILQIINFGLIWFVRYKIEEIWGKNTKKNTRKPKPTKGMPPADQGGTHTPNGPMEARFSAPRQ